MTKKEMETLFVLCEKLYAEECKKSGIITIPYAFAKNGHGEFVVFSMFGKMSEQIEKLLWAYRDLIENGEQ